MTSKAWPLAVARPTAEDDFDALFLAHYEEVYRLLYRIVGTREAAEDVAQETFLRLSRQRFGPGREHNVRAWLYRVASNLAFNALRGQGRRQRREEQTVYEVATGGLAPDPADAAAQADERAAVRRALSRLPERQAQLLLLRHAGLSYRELAEALAVAPGSVGTLLARAEAAFEKAWGAL
ncbi:MAG: sigma-70 family RNA polymerase sigma factor [Chloroflexi bacterium]|nr:sigma-70 family RNA polymerase sigma factor [Chloroflexota bacterium]